MLVRTAQLPIPPEGADRIIVTSSTVIVLDGASAFGPATSATVTLALGDSYIAYPSAGATTVLTDDRMDRLNLPQARSHRERLAAGSGYDAAHTATLQEHQSCERARRNTPDGYWIASVDPQAAAHALTATLPKATLEWIVLATDGVIETARHLALDDWDAMAHSGQAGLSALLQRCHEWEENTDPDGRQFPRAKRHDDEAIATIHRT